MSEEQRSLSGYKSKVHEKGEFDNPNVGKPPLNEDDEYILRLVKTPHTKIMPVVKEKDGQRKTVQVEKAVCEFEEMQTHNIVLAFLRVDDLRWTDDESFEMAVMKFFRKLKHPLVEGVAPNWDDYFIPNMRFRSRVAVGKGEDKKLNSKYFLDIPTVRPLLPSDKAGEDFARESTQQQTSPTPTTAIPNPNLANALLLAHGAKTHQEAMDMLSKAQASKEVVMALFQANLDGLLKFPI
jgi:hypothetical protein